MKFEVIREFNALSEEVFGRPSRWRKLYDQGEPIKMEAWDATKTVRHTVLRPFTEDTMRAYLLKMKAQKQELLDKMKASQPGISDGKAQGSSQDTNIPG